MGNINACVDWRLDGDVGLVVMDNLPVNALGHTLRDGIAQALARAAADPAVRVVVLAGTERAFSGGADITEFGQPPRDPDLRQVIAQLDAMQKPVVAAISGLALGGGLELALGCHVRVAWPKSRLGLPEVKLGLLPGAGGTQRLPRVIGLEKALTMITSGNPIMSEEGHTLGLIDAVMSGAFPDAAVAHARSVTTLNRVRDLPLDGAAAIDALAAPVLKASGAAAPKACVEALRAAASLPFDEGLARERALFQELVASDESRAQRHAFFAEREAQKLPEGKVAGRPVSRAAVIGAGTMGGGIAMSFANAGLPVTIIETAQDALDRGLKRIEELYETSAKRGSISGDEARARRGRITGKVGLDGVREADIVVEAVFEEMAVKKQVFGELDRLAKPGAVLATNTSYLDIDEIAASTSRPGDVLGMHFFSPANVMKLLEAVRGRQTSPEVIATAVEVGKKLSKVPVVVGNCFGFVGNRMLARRSEQAERLLLEGAAPQDVDRALTDFGFKMGPFAMSDLAGLDIGWRIRKAFGKTAPVSDALSEQGRFGQKTGSGYYLYEGRASRPDPAVDAIIAEQSAKLGIARRAIGQQEITERLIYPMINEGARILDEGVATRPGDIDVIWLHGYNWPAWRGGPMWYADLIGLTHVRNRLAAYAEASGDESLRPAPLLDRLARDNKGFTAT